MSLLKRLAKGVGKLSSAVQQAGPLASFIPGVGPSLAGLSTLNKYASLVPQGGGRSRAVVQPASADLSFGYQPPGYQAASYAPVGSMGSLPAIGRAAGALGARVNWARIWTAVKVIGIGAVASALNMEVGQLAAELLAHPKKHRRKGITARQLSSARRVNRIVGHWNKQLHASAPRRTKRC